MARKHTVKKRRRGGSKKGSDQQMATRSSSRSVRKTSKMENYMSLLEKQKVNQEKRKETVKNVSALDDLLKSMKI